MEAGPSRPDPGRRIARADTHVHVSAGDGLAHDAGVEDGSAGRIERNRMLLIDHPGPMVRRQSFRPCRIFLKPSNFYHTSSRTDA